MNASDPAVQQVLLRIGATTAAVVTDALSELVPDGVQAGEVTIAGDRSPFAGIKPGWLAIAVQAVSGSGSTTVFAVSPTAAQRLVAAAGTPAPPAPEADLDDEVPTAGGDPEASGAVGDDVGAPEPKTEPDAGAAADDGAQARAALAAIAGPMAASAVSAVGLLVGMELELTEPTVSELEGPEDALTRFGRAPHTTVTEFQVGGEPCRLIQLLPTAFLVRTVNAAAARGDELATGPLVAGTGAEAALAGALGDISLRVWAELGRTRIPLGDALSLPPGAVVELDCDTDAPVALYVNGLRFGLGRLMVSDDGRWAFELDEVLAGRA